MNIAWLAWKIISFKGNPSLQKFSMATSIIAIGIGVAGLLITLGVVEGFHSEIKNRILGLSPHIFVRLNPAPGQNLDSIEKRVTQRLPQTSPQMPAAAFSIGQAMIRSSYSSAGMLIKAVDPQKEPLVTGIRERLIAGVWLPVQHDPKIVPVLIGIEAAKTLGVTTNDEVALIASTTDGLTVAMPRIKKARVVGIFESGYYEYDSSLAYMPIAYAPDLWQIAGKNDQNTYWIGLRTPNPETAPQTTEKIWSLLAGLADVVAVLPWSRMNRSLFSALKLEKIMLGLVLSLIILVASISVTTNLFMICAQKTKMVGSLRSLGLTKGEIQRLMLCLGGLLGAAGCLLGGAIAVPLGAIIQHTNLITLPADVYMLTRVPFDLKMMDAGLVIILAWLLCVIAGIFPARYTGKIDISQILRYG